MLSQEYFSNNKSLETVMNQIDNELEESAQQNGNLKAELKQI